MATKTPTIEELVKLSPEQLTALLKDAREAQKIKGSTIDADRFGELMGKATAAVNDLLVIYKRLKNGNASPEMMGEFVHAVGALGKDKIEESSAGIVPPTRGRKKTE